MKLHTMYKFNILRVFYSHFDAIPLKNNLSKSVTTCITILDIFIFFINEVAHWLIKHILAK